MIVKFGLIPWPGILAGAVIASRRGRDDKLPLFKLKGHYFANHLRDIEIFNRLFMVWYGWRPGARLWFHPAGMEEFRMVPDQGLLFLRSSLFFILVSDRPLD